MSTQIAFGQALTVTGTATSPDLKNAEAITSRVLGIIAANQKQDIASVTTDSTFEELGIDSMDAVNIVFELEKAFNIDVPDEEMKKIRSVRDIVDGVQELVLGV
jgi:acyl carrier protein